jgi:hypothetical protein
VWKLDYTKNKHLDSVKKEETGRARGRETVVHNYKPIYGIHRSTWFGKIQRLFGLAVSPLLSAKIVNNWIEMET